MEGIVLKNKIYRNKFNRLLKNYGDQLFPPHLTLIKTVIIRFKKYSNNEYYVLLSLLFSLYYFKIIDLDDKVIKKRDRKSIKRMIEVYEYTLIPNYREYVFCTMKLNSDLLLFKIIIKYTILLSEDHYMKLIANPENYYKSCGYMIPCLTLAESRLLPFFQDIYFKKLYPSQFREAKQVATIQESKHTIPGGYHIEVVNDLSHLITEARVLGQTLIRKKTFFSVYNKMQRKNSDTISDSIGVRILFQNLKDIYKFIEIFENKFVHTCKKDYISFPKKNGYRSIHYKYINPYKNGDTLVELQLRTIEMDKAIHTRNEVSHFTYTIKENKWAPLFTEVHEGYEYMLEYMENKKNRH